MDIHCLPKCTINYLQESDKTLINDQCPSCSNICNQAVNSELDRNPFGGQLYTYNKESTLVSAVPKNKYL